MKLRSKIFSVLVFHITNIWKPWSHSWIFHELNTVHINTEYIRNMYAWFYFNYGEEWKKKRPLSEGRKPWPWELLCTTSSASLFHCISAISWERKTRISHPHARCTVIILYIFSFKCWYFVERCRQREREREMNDND